MPRKKNFHGTSSWPKRAKTAIFFLAWDPPDPPLCFNFLWPPSSSKKIFWPPSRNDDLAHLWFKPIHEPFRLYQKSCVAFWKCLLQYYIKSVKNSQMVVHANEKGDKFWAFFCCLFVVCFANQLLLLYQLVISQLPAYFCSFCFYFTKNGWQKHEK